VLAAYVTHARKAAGTARRGLRGRRPADVLDTRKVREWARAEGIDIKERGWVPAEIIEKYKAAVA
jgi:Lsr2